MFYVFGILLLPSEKNTLSFNRIFGFEQFIMGRVDDNALMLCQVLINVQKPLYISTDR